MKRSTIITIAVAVAFGVMLLYSTLTSQNVECTVTVEYNGRSNSATASGASESEALQQAQTTACGPIISGMNESIACGKVVPVAKSCRSI
ncbi:MAG TPA: hypothetical protein PK948_00585 [Gemmatimonadales bacterium]|jgi:hypothetical protein|nr:hypothetical protein [Gemmatimonadales bacterium]